MSKPRELPKGSEKTIVFNFFNFSFLRKLSKELKINVSNEDTFGE